MPPSSSVPTAVNCLRLWCSKRISRNGTRRAPRVLAAIKQYYLPVLVHAEVQDLAFMCVSSFHSLRPRPRPRHPLFNCRTSDHSYSSDHSLVRGYNSSGWPSFAIHYNADPSLDEGWVYHVDPFLKRCYRRRRCAIDPVFTDVYHPFKLDHHNFCSMNFKQVRFRCVAFPMVSNFISSLAVLFRPCDYSLATAM